MDMVTIERSQDQKSGPFGSANGREGDRPHVLFMIDQLCEGGGAERCLLNTIRLLQQEHFRCSLATFKIDRSGIFADLPCPVHVFPLRRTYDWNALKVALAIRRLVRTEDVKIVHTFFETSDLWGGLVTKSAGSARLVSARRDMGILRHGKHQIAYRLLAPMFDTVLTVSEQVRGFCIRQDRLHPNRVVTLYNGIDLAQIDAAAPSDALRRLLKLDEASHIVATVGHIRPVKGIDVMVDAAAQVCKQLPRARFLVIGDVHDRAYFSQLEERVRSFGIGKNVQFIGPSEAVFSILKLCDVFCLPSRSEGFSNALIEAMACGLPCVATDVGGNGEAVADGYSGFLVKNEDATSMARCLLQLLTSPELAARFGKAARAAVESKFTSQAMTGQLVAVYEGLLGRPVVTPARAVVEGRPT